MEKRLEQLPLEVWVGRVLCGNRDIEEAFKAFDKEGNRLFCKDKDGNILEINGGQDSPIQPIVIFDEWVNFGKDDEKAEHKRLPVPEFLALHPMVIDVAKELGE
jgi:hypothetical protein